MMLKNTAGPTIADSIRRRHWPLQSLSMVHCFLYTPGRITHSGTRHLWLRCPTNVTASIQPAPSRSYFCLLTVAGDVMKDEETAERCGVGYEPKAAILRLGKCLVLHPWRVPKEGSGALGSSAFWLIYCSVYIPISRVFLTKVWVLLLHLS